MYVCAVGWRVLSGCLELSSPHLALLRLTFPACHSWSPSQTPRNVAYGNARFEQTHLEYQPQPQSAMQMIANEPTILVQGRKAVCDGGQSILPSINSPSVGCSLS